MKLSKVKNNHGKKAKYLRYLVYQILISEIHGITKIQSDMPSYFI